jgi:hypothetical protein
MNIDQRENLIHRYLLGELAETDQTAFEEELLSDRDKFEHVWSIENELIDSYVRGEMSAADRARFEKYYLASSLHRERVAIARLFIENIDEPEGETESIVSWWSRFLNSIRSLEPALVAALLLAFLLLAGGLWAMRERASLTEEIAKLQDDAQKEHTSQQQREAELSLRNRELERELASGRQLSEQLKGEIDELRQQSLASQSVVISYLLKPASVRSENSPDPPTVNIFNGRLRFLMQLESRDHQSYRIKLQTAEGREISINNTDKVVSIIAEGNNAKGNYLAEVTIPARKLAKGEYVIILLGQTTGGRGEEIERFFFRAQ